MKGLSYGSSNDAWETLLKVWLELLTVHDHGIEKNLPLLWLLD